MARTPSVWRWQLIFAGGVLSIGVIIAALRPGILGEPLFMAGVLSGIVITVLTMIIPWDRVSPGWIAVIPFVDIIAIGLLTSAPEVYVHYLWVFPVTWIATYYGSGVIAAAIGLVSVFLIVFATTPGSPSHVVLRVLSTVIALAFLSTIIRISSRRSRAARRLLRRQSAQVDRAALRAERHERQVTQIIDALDIALIAVSGDGSVLKRNDAYGQLYGHDRSGPELPPPAIEYDDRRGEPLPPEQTLLARARRGEEVADERLWLYDGDGRWRALRANTRPIESAGATPITLLIIEDITEGVAAADERRAMTAIVSHELRNPLTAIIGHVDLLREREDLPPRVQEQLAAIANASERMQRLIAMALRQARDEGDVLGEPVDLRQIAEAAVALFRPTAEAKDLVLGIDGADTVIVRGDAFQLRQALDNLLSNALKYTRPGGSVTVRIDRDRGVPRLSVHDTGTGVSAADLPKLFEPYFRSHDAVLSEAPGTGLGMGIVQEIVGAHGADIAVSSELGIGTEVVIRFTADAVAERAAEETRDGVVPAADTGAGHPAVTEEVG